MCNLHDPAALVSEIYEADAIYYNYKPVIRGTAAISAEYNYMAREQYELSFSPLHIQAVAPSIVFEVGQCSGSYGGQVYAPMAKRRSRQMEGDDGC